ncbi:alanine--tRNA ligase [Mucilaginibacter sp. E4BP6]|uniref:alanine--tRNA ligase n=1 Tax=Mucilaginibacter sp. E4BP6 TaxID=2723089 RepID=UPI001840CFB0|nr:alanine--tRNA ligase [Mucilaginibacter sp. E4BP6]NYE65972.1 alanyl-tRNA synthetase [Mucilaginibacter sp. E4BP6]
MTATEIRQAFLDFFAAKGHTIVPSAPIVVKDDPTLMFTNAGMNQFKAIFLGEEPAKFPRVADTQRCLRVSGKHNDLEEVGIDTYHHTMFEMLGNWSFGDYFKKEAIDWSWELLTKVYKLDKDRLYVTYFEGDEKEGLAKDTETYDLWKQYVDEAHILPGNKKDNFWEMGETGPCGPCSEIHFDSRPDNERKEVSGAVLVNADHDQVIEIWNNVFMQFNRLKDSSLQPLPAQHVDTGMGFERLVRVLQGKTSNYDTDVFQPLIQFIAEKSGKKYNSAAKPGDADWSDAVAMRVMADHIRAISFAIADGLLPSNNKAGYVIRRILRRAVRYQYQYLGFKEPFLNTLVPLLADQFKGVFDELYSQKDFVQKVILEEEVSFLRTLGKGINILEGYIGYLNEINDFLDKQYGQAFENTSIIEVANYGTDSGDKVSKQPYHTADYLVNTNFVVLKLAQYISNYIDAPITGGFKTHELERIINDKKDYYTAYNSLKNYINKNNVRQLPSEIAFELSDTYGFPIDLTELMAREEEWTVDLEGFEEALQAQKSRSRLATTVNAGDWIVLRPGDNTLFIGYDEYQTNYTEILKYRKVVAQGKELYHIVLSETPFYAESGGQVGDTGAIVSEWYDEKTGPVSFQVIDTKKENGLTIHIAELMPIYSPEGEVLPPSQNRLPGGNYMAYINMGNRMMTNANHSATHLMHAALKEIVGGHVNQKGSLVNPDALRFDFSHFSKVSEDDLVAVERVVNMKIMENVPLNEQRNVRYQDAIASGVTALFGEKYGDYVRVITFDDNFSKELCGGTHVKATGEIGFFKILSESAVAAGVRRIEAITSFNSLNYIQEQSKMVQDVKDLLKNPNDITKSIADLLEENNRLKKAQEKAVLQKASGLKQGLADKAQVINGINFIAERVELPNADAIKNLAYQIKDIVSDLFLILAADIDGKPNLTVMLSENLVKEKGLNAGNIVRELAKEIQGGGGGQPFFATAGGKDVSGIHRALEKAKSFIA